MAVLALDNERLWRLAVPPPVDVVGLLAHLDHPEHHLHHRRGEENGAFRPPLMLWGAASRMLQGSQDVAIDAPPILHFPEWSLATGPLGTTELWLIMVGSWAEASPRMDVQICLHGQWHARLTVTSLQLGPQPGSSATEGSLRAHSHLQYPFLGRGLVRLSSILRRLLQEVLHFAACHLQHSSQEARLRLLRVRGFLTLLSWCVTVKPFALA